MSKRWIRLAAVGVFLIAITPAAWGAPAGASIEVGPQGGLLALMSGLWSELEIAWSRALSVLGGESSPTQDSAFKLTAPITPLNSGETCQETGTWAGCANDPDGSLNSGDTCQEVGTWGGCINDPDG